MMRPKTSSNTGVKPSVKFKHANINVVSKASAPSDHKSPVMQKSRHSEVSKSAKFLHSRHPKITYDLPKHLIVNDQKVKVDIKACIFDFDKTISENDVYADDWDEEVQSELFYGSEQRLTRLKSFFEKLKKHDVMLFIVSQNLQNNIDNSLMFTGLQDQFDKENIFTRLDQPYTKVDFNKNQKMTLIQSEIIQKYGLEKHNILFFDDKEENMESVDDYLIPVVVKTRGIDEHLMSLVEGLQLKPLEDKKKHPKVLESRNLDSRKGSHEYEKKQSSEKKHSNEKSKPREKISKRNSIKTLSEKNPDHIDANDQRKKFGRRKSITNEDL